jgi:Iap family predicted aminopeptidase
MARAFAVALAFAFAFAFAGSVVLAACGGSGSLGSHGSPRSAATGAPARPAGEGSPARRAGDPSAHLRALARAAREHGGTRATGTPGDRASRAYVAATLRAAGYRVTLQPFRVAAFGERRPPVVRPQGARALGRRAAATLQFSGSGRVSARLRAVRPRAHDSGCARADFRALRPGEVALVRRGTCTLRAKALAAQRAGARAVLIVNDEPEGTIPGTLQRPGVRVPVVGLSRAAGAALLRRGGVVAVAVDALSGRRETANVIGERGRGSPVVMAGAHLDSVPAGPGMNDDGSGAAAVLAAVERLRARAPEAHVRVGFWGAEELGLVGSRRYVRALSPARRRDLRAYVNLDMVGSPRPRRLVYGDAEVRRVLARHLPGAHRTSIGGASDHAAFARAGVPVGGLFSGGGRSDPCYHRRCDDLDNVDLRSLRRMTRTATAALADLAA